MTEDLRQALLDLRDRDQEKRQELVERGELFEGYHPEMERVHRENAQTLEEILDHHGWPSEDLVGPDGVEAVSLVVNHAIGLPAFQRKCLALLSQAQDQGQDVVLFRARLEDRIRYNERRPQVYGFLMDWDEEGQLSPWLIEHPEKVDARRAALGLGPLQEQVKVAREQALQEKAQAPKPFAERQAEILAWAREVGWLEEPSGDP